MKGNALIVGIILLVVGALVYLFFQNPIHEQLNPPKPIPGAKTEYGEKFCPPTIYFDNFNKETDFKIGYKNSGSSDGVFTVALSSDKLVSRYKGDLEGYRKVAIKGWFVESNNNVDYNFKLKINLTEYPTNFTATAELSCSYETSITKDLTCSGITSCCKYSRDEFSQQYSLISEVC